MKSRVWVMLAIGLCSSAFSLPIISGPNTIHIDDPFITLTLSGTEDDIFGFEGYVWVEYFGKFDAGYITSPPDETVFRASVGGADSYIDLGWWEQGGGVGFGAIPDSGQTIPVGEWFDFDITREITDLVGDTISVDIVSNDLYNILSSYTVTVVAPEPATIVLLSIGGMVVFKSSRVRNDICHPERKRRIY